MKNIKWLLSIVAVTFISFNLLAQDKPVQKFLGARVEVSTVEDLGNGNYRVTANFFDETGVYKGTDVGANGQYIYYSRPKSVGDDCNRYVITSLPSQFQGSVQFICTDIDNQGEPSTGTNAIIEESLLGIPHWISGVGDPLNQCISSYIASKVGTSNGGGDQEPTLLNDLLGLTNTSTTVDLSIYKDAPQSLSLTNDLLSISSYPFDIDLSIYKDNTDNQQQSFDPNTGVLSLTNSPDIQLPITNTGDNWGQQVAITDGITMGGDGTLNNPLVSLGGGGGASMQKYYVGSQDDGVFIISNSTNITYSRSNNIVDIIVPAGAEVEKLIPNCNVSFFSIEDFKIRVTMEGVSYNNNYNNSNVGTMSFLKTYGRRIPNSSQYWNYDDDFPPTTQKQITNSTNSNGNSVIEFTFKNAKSSGTNSFKCVLDGYF